MTDSVQSPRLDEAPNGDATGVGQLHVAGLRIRLAREALNGRGSDELERVDVHLAAALDALDVAVQALQRHIHGLAGHGAAPGSAGPPPRHRGTAHGPDN